MICRVSMAYWDKRREDNMPREDRDKTEYPHTIEEMVDEVLSAIWAAKDKTKKTIGGLLGKAKEKKQKKKKKEFPDYVPLDLDNDADSD